MLFAAECLTLLRLGHLLTLHVFLGMLLVGPAGLKIASTLWRFTRYYTGSTAYVRRGPPAPLQRVTGPFVILTTVVVLASGIMLSVAGPGPGSFGWLQLHRLSFLAWAESGFCARDRSDVTVATRPRRGTRSWTAHPAWCAAAGVPADRAFETGP